MIKLDSGKYSIDRDEEYFKYILEYLRNPTEEYRNYNDGCNKEKTERILREAIFFELKGLENSIKEALPVLTLVLFAKWGNRISTVANTMIL